MSLGNEREFIDYLQNKERGERKMYEFIHRIDSQVGTTDPDPEPRQHYEVHCGRCNWWGMIDQLRTIYKPNPLEPGDVIPTPGCPICLSDQWLEYKEN